MHFTPQNDLSFFVSVIGFCITNLLKIFVRGSCKKKLTVFSNRNVDVLDVIATSLVQKRTRQNYKSKINQQVQNQIQN